MFKELKVDPAEPASFRIRLGELFNASQDADDRRLYLFMTLCVMFVESRRLLPDLHTFAEWFERPLSAEEAAEIERLKRSDRHRAGGPMG